MWKNRDAANEKRTTKKSTSSLKSKSGTKIEEPSTIENEFIDNLKQQIYFMEMELNERERKRNCKKWRIYSVVQ